LWTRFRESKRGSEKTLPNGTDKTTRVDRQLSPESRSHFRRRNARVLAHGYAATVWIESRSPGVSKATVYSHFQDKEGLFTALIQRLVEGKFRSILILPMRKSANCPEIILKI